MNNGIDKDALYGRYQKREDHDSEYRQAQRKLSLRLAHKATDTPFDAKDEMNIDARKTFTQHGVGTLGALGIALAATLPPSALLGWHLLKGQPAAVTTPTAPVATQAAPVSTTTAPAFSQKDSDFASELYDPLTGEVIDRIFYRSRSGVVEQKMPDGTWKPAPHVKPPQ